MHEARLGYLGPTAGVQGPQGPPGASHVTADDAAALTALDVSLIGNTSLARVETYRDFFFLDKTTVRTAVADEVIASSSPTAWWVRMEIPDPTWALQTTWYVNPLSGDDEHTGIDASHPLKTRSEFARRVNGATLLSPVTVNITSSLNTGDTRHPVCQSDLVNFITYVGVPVLLFSGQVTAYTARSGADSQPTLMTIASLPSTWTAGAGGTSFLNKLVEWTDGAGNFITSVVVQDLGSKQAWLSPPLNQNNLETPFVNGTTVSVYDLPSLGNQEVIYNYRTHYQYLKVAGSLGRWINYGGQCTLFKCSGDSVSVSGVFNTINGVSSLVSGASLLASGMSDNVNGGYHRIIVAGGNTRISAPCTIRALQVEMGGTIAGISGGAQGTTDFEFNAPSTTLIPILQNGIGPGQITCQGYVYGTTGNAAGKLIELQGRSSTVSFSHTPDVAGGTLISYLLAGTTDLVSALSIRVSSDINGNRVIGPAGPSRFTERADVLLAAQHILTETYPRVLSSSTAPMVSGTIYFTEVPLLAGDVVSNITIGIGSPGEGITLAKVGLCDSAGTRLAASADQGTSWETAGLKPTAMATPFTVLTSGLYYVAALCIFTVTGPSICAASFGTTLINGSINGGALPYGVQTGQSDLPSTAVIVAGTSALSIYGAIT